MNLIKVFNMNDSDWIAAKNKEEAIQCFADMFNEGIVDDDLIDSFEIEPEELTQEEMNKSLYPGDDDNPYKTPISFAEELKKRIDAGEKFPQSFATSEA